MPAKGVLVQMSMVAGIALGLYLAWKWLGYRRAVEAERQQTYIRNAPGFRELRDEARGRLRLDPTHAGWQRPVWIPLPCPPLATCLSDRMTCYVWRKDDVREGVRRWTIVVWFKDRKYPWTFTFLGDRFRYGNVNGADGPRRDVDDLSPYELRLVNEFGRLVLGAYHASAYA